MRSSRWQQQYTEQYQQRESINPVRGTEPRLSQAMPTLDANIVARGGAGDRLLSQALGAGHDLAKTAFRVNLHEQEEERALKATEIVNNWRSGLNQFHADYTQNKQGELAANAGKEFSAFARQSGNEVLEGIRDDKLRRMVMHSMSPVAVGFEDSGLHYGNQQVAARKKNLLENAEAQLLQDAGQNASNQTHIAEIVGAYKERFRAAHAGFDTTAAEKTIDDKIFKTRFSAMLAGGNASGAQGLLRRFGGELSPEDRLRFEHVIDAHRSRGLALQERELKKQRAATEKDLYAAAFDGKLTREDVEAQRDILTPDDYSKFLKLSRGETRLPDKSDPDALILLQRKAINGDADFQDTADELLRQGKLSNSDFTSRTNEAQQWRKPAMKEADNILRAKTGHSDFNPNPDAANSYIMAHRDFMAWLDSAEGKKADDSVKLSMAERIGDLYRLNTAPTTLSVPSPLNLVGTRTQPDIAATIQKIETEKRAGRLTEGQYRQEMMRIKRIADIIEKRAASDRGRAAGRNAR